MYGSFVRIHTPSIQNKTSSSQKQQSKGKKWKQVLMKLHSNKERINMTIFRGRFSSKIEQDFIVSSVTKIVLISNELNQTM